MMTKEEFSKIANFMTPGTGVLVLGCGHIRHIVKMHYFFKNLLFYSQASIRQTKYVVMMTKEGSTKIIHDHLGRVSCAMVWPYKSYSDVYAAKQIWRFWHFVIISDLVSGVIIGV